MTPRARDYTFKIQVATTGTHLPKDRSRYIKELSTLRNDPEYNFEGIAGLWLAVLVDIMRTIEKPVNQADLATARWIVRNRRGCFETMAAAIDRDPVELQKRIIEALEKKGIKL